MRVLYLPNEPTPGWQVGPRAALAKLRSSGLIAALEVYSFLQKPARQSMNDILRLAETFRPDVILMTKVGDFPVTSAWLTALRGVDSRPLLAYYDGDVYGRVFKRFSEPMATLCRHAHCVFLCALGSNSALFERHGARTIFHHRHSASIEQFGTEWEPTPTRELDVVVIGHRHKGRFAIQDRFRHGRMPGVHEREMVVRRLGTIFGDRFAVFGAGWEGFVGNRGPIAFDQQHSVLRKSWLSVGYDHFPDVPYYFSDRLPVALLSGVAHVVGYHPGYEAIFENGRELLWGTSLQGIVDAVRFALSRGPDYLNALAARGRAFAVDHLLDDVVYREMVMRLVAARRAHQRS